jgi:sterol desaturase/sphingolipid hydroxylase (fatty acid hydroxylase superfamily)
MHTALAFAARMAEMMTFIVIGFVLETFFEARSGVRDATRLFNIVCTFLFEGFSFTAGVLFADTVSGLVRKAPLHDLIYPGYDHGSFVRAIGLVLFQLCIADFFYYWIHRLLLHRSLWAGVHEIHHADENMNVTTAKRVHWLENPLQTIFGTVPTVVLFKPALITVAAAILIGDAIPFFAHLNARIDIGPLKRFFVNPQTHRVHHSKLPQHIDKNFASHFAFWDVLFGTYYYPQQGEWPDTGLADGKLFNSIWDVVVLPVIVWARNVSRGFASYKSMPRGSL